MRIAIGSIKQETNSFSRERATLQAFQEGLYWATAEQMVATFSRSRNELAAFIHVLQANGHEIIPTFAANAMSSGPLTQEAHEWLLAQVLDGLRKAGRVDGVLLAMHGAMVADGYEDATGHIIAEVRKQVGKGVPIGVSLDWHAHVTPQFVDNADFLIAFETFPHIDLYDTGRRVAEMLMRRLRGEIRPVAAMTKVPMVAAAEGQHHDRLPMRRLLDAARAAEKEPGVLSASLFPVQCWMDIPNTGFGVIVVADGDRALAEATAKRLAQMAWEARHEFDVPLLKPDEAIRRALAHSGHPIVLSDSADSVGAGSAGNGTNVLKALLAANVQEPALITLIDREAVQQAIAAGFNQTVTLSVGGKADPINNQPVTVTGRVKTISDAAYNAYGVVAPMGPCVVLEIGKIQLLLMSYKAHTISPSVYRAVGLEPTEAKIVVVKSALQFRDEFEPIAAEVILVDAPGVSSANLKALPFRNITRPLYPFDAI